MSSKADDILEAIGGCLDAQATVILTVVVEGQAVVVAGMGITEVLAAASKAGLLTTVKVPRLTLGSADFSEGGELV